MFKIWMKKGFCVVAAAAFLFAFLPAGLAFAQGSTHASSSTNGISTKKAEKSAKKANQAGIRSVIDRDRDRSGKSSQFDSDWRFDSTQSSNWANSVSRSLDNYSARLLTAQERGVNIAAAQSALTNYQYHFHAYQFKNFQKFQMHSKNFRQSANDLHQAYNEFSLLFRSLHLNDKDYVPGVSR